MGLFIVALGADAVLAQPRSLSAGEQYTRDIVGRNSRVNYSIDGINANIINSSQGIGYAPGVSTGLSNSAFYQSAGSGRGGSALTSKPFSNVTQDRGVSPYLGLFNETLDADFDQYNTIVRPQLQQQRVNQQLQRQQQQLNQRVQQISAQPAFSPQGSQNALSTGHPTFFNNTLNYYPLRNQRRR
ncbi:MAG: hypothetical protein AAFV43_04235 [Planctomycetota bacterium]